MGIAQYAETIKTKLPFLETLTSKVALPASFKGKFELIDKRQLMLSCAGVLGFYVLVFAYVFLSADNTIAKMEEKMATVSVKLTEKAPSPLGIGANNAPKPDIDVNAMTKANLVKGLSRYDSEFGRLPVIRTKDQLTSFRAYQTPFSLNGIGNKPVISFVLKDYGLSDKTSNMALDILPPEVSFMLSPYADLPQEWINRAREKGHEVWMEVPVQQNRRVDTGLNTIFHHDSIAEKGKTMRISLSRGLGYVGVAFFMDDGISEMREHYSKLLEEVYGRGLAVLETNPIAPTFMETIAVTKAAPYIKSTDEVKRVSGINPFTSVENTAQKTKQSIALIPSYPVLVKDLALWIEKVGKVDYVVAPASAIYDLPLARAGAISEPVKKLPTPHALDANDLADPGDHSDGH